MDRGETWDCIAAVPLHWRRRWGRGFNQSELLARRLAGLSGVPFASLLKRVRATPAQAGLSSARRRRNLAGAFACRRQAASLQGQRILLIDDVMTTGSTLAACARVLKRAGAARVGVLTVARADRRFDVPAGRQPIADQPIAESPVETADEAATAGQENWGVRV